MLCLNNLADVANTIIDPGTELGIHSVFLAHYWTEASGR